MLFYSFRRLSDDDGGHLIATVFNGSGDCDNLVPMNSNLNRSAWKKMENNWVKLLKQGCQVKITITITYPNSNNLRPDFFEIKTVATHPTTGEKREGIQSFKNIKGQEFNEKERVVF